MRTLRNASFFLLPLLLLLLVPSTLMAEAIEREVRTEVIVLTDEDGAHHDLALDKENLECFEEGDKKVCIGHAGHTGSAAKRGFLGVQLTPMTSELRAHMGAPDDAGVLVSKVEEDSPAARAGLEVGDVITAVDQENVESVRDLQHAIASRADGDLATLEIYRDGRLEQITATLGEQEGHHGYHRMRLHGLEGDLGKVLEHVNESLSDLNFDFDFDFDELGPELQERLSEIDWDAIREKIHAALSGIGHEDSK